MRAEDLPAPVESHWMIGLDWICLRLMQYQRCYTYDAGINFRSRNFVLGIPRIQDNLLVFGCKLKTLN